MPIASAPLATNSCMGLLSIQLDVHRQTQRMPLMNADDAASLATLRSSSTNLLGLVPRLTSTTNGDGCGENESGQDLTLNLGPGHHGCLQVLEIRHGENQPKDVEVGDSVNDNDNDANKTRDNDEQQCRL